MLSVIGDVPINSKTHVVSCGEFLNLEIYQLSPLVVLTGVGFVCVFIGVSICTCYGCLRSTM